LNHDSNPNEFNATGPADELWMQEALNAAQRALEMGDVPVGVNFFIPIGEAIERLGIHASGSST